jgi:hypothetical protein
VRFVADLRLVLDDMEAVASSIGSTSSQSGQGSSDTVENNFKRPVRCLAMYYSNGVKSPRIGGLMLAESIEHKGLYQRIGLCSTGISVFEGFPIITVAII